jgi:hypothetical protein
MNISEQPLDPRYLRKIPTYTDGEPMGKIEFDDPTFRKSIDTLHDEGMKLGGKGKRDKMHNEKIAELIRENEWMKRTIADRESLVCEFESLYEGMVELYRTERKRSARWKAAAKKYKNIFTED